MTVIENQVFDKPCYDNGDVIRCFGNPGDYFVIKNCVFNFLSYDVDALDELVSCVNGADVHIENCIFLGGPKAVMAGNGEYPIADSTHGSLVMENCFIGWSGRRCPEVKHGVKATMRNCWIHDWGMYFDTRAFGAWACDGGTIIAEHCLFTRTLDSSFSFFLSWKDRFNHLGFAINRNGIGELFRPRNWRSGLNRALTAWDTGTVYASKCYCNSDDIIIENCNEYLTKNQAIVIVEHLNNLCPNPQPYIDDTLLGLWDSLF
ncbi:MAG: hypothetical protein IJA20_02850 [Methanocorpusculum sp.]|nr:hypothetical protein [Methanocorpusculum sp.]